MSIAGIRFLQDTAERSDFDWDHYNEHLNIAQAINSVLGITVPVLALHPVGDKDAWARMHQQMHDDMHKACGTDGHDLTASVFEPDWVHHNYMEHAAVNQVLGI